MELWLGPASLNFRHSSIYRFARRTFDVKFVAQLASLEPRSQERFTAIFCAHSPSSEKGEKPRDCCSKNSHGELNDCIFWWRRNSLASRLRTHEQILTGDVVCLAKPQGMEDRNFVQIGGEVMNAASGDEGRPVRTKPESANW